MYISVSVQLCGQTWKHAHDNCVGALTYQLAGRMPGRAAVLARADSNPLDPHKVLFAFRLAARDDDQNRRVLQQLAESAGAFLQIILAGTKPLPQPVPW